jgi:hypothetical protein
LDAFVRGVFCTGFACDRAGDRACDLAGVVFVMPPPREMREAVVGGILATNGDASGRQSELVGGVASVEDCG